MAQPEVTDADGNERRMAAILQRPARDGRTYVDDDVLDVHGWNRGGLAF
jgi:hypothetical protein